MHAVIAWLPLLAAETDAWSERFFGLDAEQRFTVILVLVGCTTGVIISLGGMVYGAVNAVHRRRLEAEMKRELLDRGMSADEIVKIIESAPQPEDATERWIASWARCRKK